MDEKLPGIIVTGASGFIGRHFIEANAQKFRLFCLARRSQKEAGVPRHANIRWSQVDVGDFSNLQHVVESINAYGGADYILHLAGYYDFTMKDQPEYEYTNVNGTRNVLKLAQYLNIRRFIFSSSLAACRFDRNPEHIITEKTPPDANYPYAVSKRKAEELIRNYSSMFPCTILRLAAVYSDWCEYPPLFVFLDTWLSDKWNSRILGGRGESSITYIHISDLVRLINSIIAQSDVLPQLSTYIASPTGTVSHKELYKAATRYFFGRPRKAIYMPRILALIGIALRTLTGDLIGIKPFERPWMMKYIDRKLVVDADYSFRSLNWHIPVRNDITRRLLFMIENMKNHTVDWTVKNETLMFRVAERFNIKAYEVLMRHREFIVNKMIEFIYQKEWISAFKNYTSFDRAVTKWYTTMLYQLMATSIKINDRIIVRRYAQAIAYRRFKSGFKADEIVRFLVHFEKIILSELLMDIEAQKTKEQLFNAINIFTQLMIDEIEESFELFSEQKNELQLQSLTDKLPTFQHAGNLKQIISDLENTFFDSMEHDMAREFSHIYDEIKYS
jgi:nucleoside-diphosphate-sugar epimerase